jgi:hypothetical protein
MQNFHKSKLGHDILHSDRSSKGKQLSINHFCEKKWECGEQLKFKIYLLLYGDNSRTVALRDIMFGTVNGH